MTDPIMTKGTALSPVDWDAQVSLRSLVESAPIALAIVDRGGQLLHVNAKLEELFGYTRAELLGQPVEILMPQRFHRAHVHHRKQYVGHPYERLMGSGMDLAGRRKDGSEFPLEVGLSPLVTGNDTVVIATITDISKRKQIEELLEQRVEERTREIERRQQVAEGLGKIVTMLNSARELTEILRYIVAQAMEWLGAQAGALYHLPAEAHGMISQVSQGFIGPTPSDEVGLTQLLKVPTALSDLTQAKQIDGTLNETQRQWLLSQGYWAVLVVPVGNDEQVNGNLCLCYRQAQHFSTENIELAATLGKQAALAIASAQLRADSERSAVVAERNRLARDLHDAVTQTLFSASMIAEVLPRIWQRNPAEGEKRLAELHELTRGALAEMRTLLLELRPAKLSEVEIDELLRQLAEAISGRARMQVDVKIDGEYAPPADVKLALYRIAQEALNNVARHARAQSVSIHLQRYAAEITLTIQDNGVGFVFEHIRSEHLGLGIMRERADAIGANLVVESTLGEGTTITLHWQEKSRNFE